MAQNGPQPLGSEEWNPGHNPLIIAMTVMLGTFMEVLDTSIANVALPHIAGNLSAGIDESTWVLTSYLVSNAIVLPLSGWLGSIFGRKRFFMACVWLFIASSCLCGLAPSLGWLVVFRILQGAGGGSMQPIAQAILVESFPRQKRGMAMAIYAMGVVVAPIIGPTVGGWITDSYNWRWIFFINIPVGILSIIMTSTFIIDPPYLVRRNLKTLKIDYMGLGLLGVGLGALQVVLDKGQREDWLESHFIIALAIIAGLCLVGAIVWELRQKDPIINLHLLHERNFAVCVLIMFVLGLVLYGSLALLPIFLQTLLGYTAMLSGLVLSPGGVMTLIALPIVGKLLSKYQPRWLTIIGIAGTSISLFMMARWDLQVDFRSAVYARMVQGLGLAFLFVPVNTMAFGFIPNKEANHATGLVNLARNIGGSCGIAFATTMLARGSQIHQNTLVSHVSRLDHAYQAMSHGATAFLQANGTGPAMAPHQALGLIDSMVQQQATMLSFTDVFRTMGILFLPMIPLLFLMKKVKPHTLPTAA
jgi:DHA2 family multidrug resistance protein